MFASGWVQCDWVAYPDLTDPDCSTSAPFQPAGCRRPGAAARREGEHNYYVNLCPGAAVPYRERPPLGRQAQGGEDEMSRTPLLFCSKKESQSENPGMFRLRLVP